MMDVFRLLHYPEPPHNEMLSSLVNINLNIVMMLSGQ